MGLGTSTWMWKCMDGEFDDVQPSLPVSLPSVALCVLKMSGTPVLLSLTPGRTLMLCVFIFQILVLIDYCWPLLQLWCSHFIRWRGTLFSCFKLSLLRPTASEIQRWGWGVICVVTSRLQGILMLTRASESAICWFSAIVPLMLISVASISYVSACWTQLASSFSSPC